MFWMLKFKVVNIRWWLAEFNNSSMNLSYVFTDVDFLSNSSNTSERFQDLDAILRVRLPNDTYECNHIRLYI